MRGWVHHVNENPGESRQIMVTMVDAGSPADGILAVNDVIPGADDPELPATDKVEVKIKGSLTSTSPLFVRLHVVLDQS